MRVFRESLFICVCSSFPFGFVGEIRDFIVLFLDRCLSILLLKSVGAGLSLGCCLVIRGSTGDFFSFFFCSSISMLLYDTLWIFRCHNILFVSSPHL